MKRRVVVTVSPYHLAPNELSKELEHQGFDVDWHVLDASNDSERVIENTRGYHAIIAGGDVYKKSTLDAIQDTVEIIARFGAGYDQIDLDLASRYGIAIANTPGASAPTIGEHAVALMLAVLRGIPKYDQRTRQGEWPATLIHQLTGKTVGLVGMGAIARVVVNLLQGFSTRVVAYDVVQHADVARESGVEYMGLEKVLRVSDVVSLHTPLTEGTRRMVNREFLGKMKKSAILINTSRGQVVNEADLVEALQNGTIAGAGLDVFEGEPLSSESPLTKLENVVMSSHIGGMSTESFLAMWHGAVKNVLDFYAGQPRNIVNPEYIYHKRS